MTYKLGQKYSELVLEAEIDKDNAKDAWDKMQPLLEAVEAERDEEKKAKLNENLAATRRIERESSSKLEKITKAIELLPAYQRVLNIFLEADDEYEFYRAREDERDESEGRSVEFAEAEWERYRARSAFIDCVETWGGDESDYDPVAAREQERISRGLHFIMRGFVFVPRD